MGMRQACTSMGAWHMHTATAAIVALHAAHTSVKTVGADKQAWQILQPGREAKESADAKE